MKKIKSKLILKILLFFSFALGASYFGYFFYIDHNEIYHPSDIRGLRQRRSRVEMAKNDLSTHFTDRVVGLIGRCKLFPSNLQEYVERESDFDLPYWRDGVESSRKGVTKYCERVPFKVWVDELGDKTKPELSYRWIDPWGRPYQLRYDLDRAKLQVRSRGRFLWTGLDDIVEETYFLGRDYSKNGLPLYVEMLERCKTVPKDDMSCIFNRGWH